MSPFRVGHGRECITPPLETKMMGYGRRTEGAREVHDDLFVNAVAFRAEEETAALLAYDLCFFDLPLVDRIKSALAEKTGLPADCVLLNTSHTHAGPRVGVWYGQEGDEDYERVVIERSADALEAALQDAADSAFDVGAAPVDIGCNRREMTAERKIRLGVNPRGPRLAEMTVWRFARKGRPDVVLFSTPMHGTTLGGNNLSISAEWMGAAVRRVEERMPDARAVFVQGCGADQNPYREDASFDLMEQHGRTAAEAVERALNHTRQLFPLPMRYGMRRVPLPLLDDESRTWPLPLHGLRLGDAVLVGLGCEAFVEYALFGRGVSQAEQTLVLAYTDGSVGYLPTADAYETGGYETEANRNFPVGSPFAPRCEEIVKRAMKEMLGALGG